MDQNSTPADIEERIKNDRFNELWKNNYVTNYTNKEFDKQGRYGIEFVNIRVKNLKIKYPCYLVNPGPSLEKNIHVLKEIYDTQSGIIVTSDVCLYRLLDSGITPDIVCTIDPDASIAKFWEGYTDKTNTIILFAPTTCSPEVIQMWGGPIVFFNQSDKFKWRNDFFKKITKYTKSYGNFLNLTFVGGTLLQVAALLESSYIFLVGWDFSTDVSGKVYCNGFMEKRIYTTLSTKEDVLKDKERFEREDHKEIRKELLEGDWKKGVEMYLQKLQEEESRRLKTIKLKSVKTNDILYSNPQYVFYKNLMLKTILPAIKSPIFNCTEGGILEGIHRIPLKESMNFIKEKIPQKLIFQLFTYYRSKHE